MSCRSLVTFNVFQVKALCFSPSTAPQVFTRVGLQEGGLLLHYYDDWLVIGELVPLLPQH